ncbi:MAG: hypothetical protein V1926_03050 [Candidatus Peregrinibacteria bacterium]
MNNYDRKLLRSNRSKRHWGQQLEVQGPLLEQVIRGLSELMFAMHLHLNQISEGVTTSIRYHAEQYNQAGHGKIQQKDPETFLPDELLAIRDKRHLTQEEATKILGLPPDEWRKWELGQGKPLAFQVHLIRLLEEGSLTLERPYRE